MLPKIQFYVGQFKEKFEGTISTGTSNTYCTRGFAEQISRNLGIQIEMTSIVWPQLDSKTVIKAKITGNTQSLFINRITVPLWFYKTNGKKFRTKVTFLILEPKEKAIRAVFGSNFLFGKNIKHLCLTNGEIVFQNGQSISLLKE